MSLGAIKKFKEATGLDLWLTLLSFIEAYNSNKELSIINRMRLLYEVCDFEIASYLFHCLIVDDGISLDEIQDGMFRVGWLPTDRDGDMSEPWPLVMVFMAYEIDKQFNELPEEAKKKADTSE